MKILVFGSSLLISAAVFPLAFAAQPVSKPAATSVAETETARRVANGMTRNEVLTSAGQPGAMLDANVWAYWQFTAQRVPESEKLDTLLVVFVGDRVSFFKFVAAEPVRAFLAQHEQVRARQQPIAGK